MKIDMRNFWLSKLMFVISAILVVVLIYLFATLFFIKESQLIYVVSKTSSENSTFWHSVERGVKVASDELGMDVIFIGPEREVDIDEQIQLVQEGIDMKPLAIILAASDYEALVDVSEKVMKAGIPFITVDSDVNIEEAHSFIATNNISAANYLGEQMADLINGKGKVAIVSHLEGATSSIDRQKGFIDALSDYKDISVIEEVKYSNNDAGIAYEKTIELLKEYPDITGIFGTNEATLIGISKAVDELSLKERVTVVGFDISKEAAGYLETGVIKGIIVQRPFNMGYLSVREAYNQSKLRKKTRENIDVDVVYVTKDNMFDEENQRFIIPFLE